MDLTGSWRGLVAITPVLCAWLRRGSETHSRKVGCMITVGFIHSILPFLMTHNGQDLSPEEKPRGRRSPAALDSAPAAELGPFLLKGGSDMFGFGRSH